MKRWLWMLPFAALTAVLIGCGDNGGDVAFTKAGEMPRTPPGPSASGGMRIAGKVIETMDANQYTYVLVETATARVWAAGPRTAVEVGEMVDLPPGQLMTDFKSATLDRTFDRIYFVTSIKGGEAAVSPHGAMGDDETPADAEAMMAAAHGHRPPATELDFAGLQKAEGGLSIEEVYAKKAELGGAEVKIRAKVARFTANVMGKNWLHLRDGTGAEGTNDVTVNTLATAKVGDTVLVTGKLTLDKDFGHGYRYPVIIEDAAVQVE